MGAGVVSTWLMWRGRPGTALLVAYTAAAIASAIVMRRDLSPLAQTRRGRYVLAHMPVAAQAVRYAGQIIAWYMAYHHRWFGIALGYLPRLGRLGRWTRGARVRPLAFRGCWEVAMTSTTRSPQSWQDPNADPSARLDALIAEMSLRESLLSWAASGSASTS